MIGLREWRSSRSASKAGRRRQAHDRPLVAPSSPPATVAALLRAAGLRHGRHGPLTVPPSAPRSVPGAGGAAAGKAAGQGEPGRYADSMRREATTASAAPPSHGRLPPTRQRRTSHRGSDATGVRSMRVLLRRAARGERCDRRLGGHRRTYETRPGGWLLAVRSAGRRDRVAAGPLIGPTWPAWWRSDAVRRRLCAPVRRSAGGGRLRKVRWRP